VLLAAGLRFTTQPAQIDEAPVKQAARVAGLRVEDAALRLAEMKARQVASDDPEALVIGADQILVCGDGWFDKPRDRAGAAVQLRALRGRTHALITAVLCHRGEERLWHHVAEPRLTMRQVSDAFLNAYLAAEGSEVTTTVGAYRLEGRGEHAAILGIPLLELLGFLRRYGLLMT
jgi:septum formation protein